MAGIIVSGDTSGAVTLSAPAVAGTVTVTLPSASGTMATLTTPSFATTIGVGNATPSASGVGITFPATESASSDANTLDDYEEGTWTPTIDSSVAGTGRATSTYGASYLKVGRLVTVRCFTQLTTLGTGGSGWIKISGLPFAAAGGDSYSSASIGYFQALKANVVYVTATIDPGGTFFEMRGLGSASGGVSSLDFGTYAQVNMAFIISCTYIST